MHSKVIIVGAGPAGIAAAIQLKRLDIDFTLINSSKEIGGLLRNANLIENYPSYPKGIKASKLIKNFENHLTHLDIKVNSFPITLIDYRDNLFYLQSVNKEGNSIFTSEYLVLATGTKPKVDNTLIFSNNSNLFINYEIKDLLEVKNKRIVIVGAGDAAFDYALNLSRKNYITILNRSQKIKSLAILVERAKANKKIEYFDNTFIDKADYSDNSFFLSCRGESVKSIICDYLIYAIGRDPNFPKFDMNLEKIANKLIQEQKLFYIGDLVNGIARQSTIAVGDGIRVAMKLNSELSIK